MAETSEIRQDPVSRDWVVISTGRAKRPQDFKKAKRQPEDTNEATCPFEDPARSGHEVLLTLPEEGEDKNPSTPRRSSGQAGSGQDWWVKVVKNKYPVVGGDECGTYDEHGPYTVQDGAGYHEVIITRDHWRSIAQMSQTEVECVIESYQKRYQTLKDAECANYILIFHNHGREAGASIFHPHSQIIAIPVIPADVGRSLRGSREYYEKNGNCIHCAMISWEVKQNKRIVFENDQMIVISPYVPRTAFELRIYPKSHEPRFEEIDSSQKRALAEALRVALGKLRVGFNDPAYNFFIHTAPARGDEEHSYYHWHLEILPKTAIWAGFELGTGIEISAIDPDEATDYLKEIDESDGN